MMGNQLSQPTDLALGAVVNPGSTQPAVFVVADGQARRVPIDLGQVLGERVTIRGGLVAGDEVAVSGHTATTAGSEADMRTRPRPRFDSDS